MRKALYFFQLPPPVHGVTTMNKRIVDSKKINAALKFDVLPISYSDDISQINSFSSQKVIKFIKYLVILFFKLLRCDYSFVYFTIVPQGVALYRDAFFILIMKLLRQKYVLHLHGKGVELFSKRRKLNHLLYKFIFCRTKVILLSEYVYDDVSRYIKKEDCFFLPNGIPSTKKPSNKNHIDRNQIPAILYLSVLCHEKGMYVLLDALGILKKENIPFKANFVGKIYTEERMSQFKQSLEKNGITAETSYLGPIYGEDKYKIYADSDIFVFPTLNEAFGLVLLEAMQLGLPVVASREGSIPLIIEEGENGFLFTKGDSVDLAEKMKKLLLDSEMRNNFGNKSRERFEEYFTFERYEDNFIAVMQSIHEELDWKAGTHSRGKVS